MMLSNLNALSRHGFKEGQIENLNQYFNTVKPSASLYKSGLSLLREWENVKYEIFEYGPYQGNGNPIQWHMFFIMKNNQIRFPDFELKPINIWFKMNHFFILKGIIFESHPEFNKNYLLTGNEQDVRPIFKKNVLNFFTLTKGMHLAGRNGKLCFIKKKKIQQTSFQKYLSTSHECYSVFN